LPINCLSWYDAMAFCIWDGGFLPTEAEWNYAASGGSEQRVYPWSNPPTMEVVDCQHVNYYNGTDYCVNPPTGGTLRVGTHSPLGDGRWGHADIAGNIWEWVLDYDAAYATPCDNCAQLTPGTNRGMRGGYFKNSMGNMRAANRSSNQPVDRPQYLGVRCARY
ncbi:MAG TPA: formylglycine-generating enzyme family protein, partial [Kofleriaceae bacterium]|nr:formylglycine-generating enzyme family protein [Kofleriaceae bacterium]